MDLHPPYTTSTKGTLFNLEDLPELLFKNTTDEYAAVLKAAKEKKVRFVKGLPEQQNEKITGALFDTGRNQIAIPAKINFSDKEELTFLRFKIAHELWHFYVVKDIYDGKVLTSFDLLGMAQREKKSFELHRAKGGNNVEGYVQTKLDEEYEATLFAYRSKYNSNINTADFRIAATAWFTTVADQYTQQFMSYYAAASGFNTKFPVLPRFAPKKQRRQPMPTKIPNRKPTIVTSKKSKNMNLNNPFNNPLKIQQDAHAKLQLQLQNTLQQKHHKSILAQFQEFHKHASSINHSSTNLAKTHNWHQAHMKTAKGFQHNSQSNHFSSGHNNSGPKIIGGKHAHFHMPSSNKHVMKHGNGYKGTRFENIFKPTEKLYWEPRTKTWD